MKAKDKYKFILLNLIILYVTMPASIYIAYFDSYYRPSIVNVITGFYNWLYFYLAFSPIVFAYLALKREKRLLGVYVILIICLIVLYVTMFSYTFPEATKLSLSTAILGIF